MRSVWRLHKYTMSGAPGMDTGNPLTPQRRPAGGSSGITPAAKRPNTRPEFREPQITPMGHEELVREFLRMRQRYEQDITWHEQNLGVFNDHAEKLDQDRVFFKTLVGEGSAEPEEGAREHTPRGGDERRQPQEPAGGQRRSHQDGHSHHQREG